MTKEKWQGHIAILCTNLIFGLNTPTAKSLVPTWISPTALTCLRMSFATVIFWIIASFFKQEKVSKKDLVIIFFGALFGLVGAQLSFAVALQYKGTYHVQKGSGRFYRCCRSLTDYLTFLPGKQRIQ